MIIIGKKLKMKYGISNGVVDEYDSKDYGYFKEQRYWVDRTFDNSKNELGLSDYQVRKWIGWHHHHSLVFIAIHFMMTERIANWINCPLLSVRDHRILIIVLLLELPIILRKDWSK